jgi:hypothetical protein
MLLRTWLTCDTDPLHFDLLDIFEKRRKSLMAAVAPFTDARRMQQEFYKPR